MALWSTRFQLVLPTAPQKSHTHTHTHTHVTMGEPGSTIMTRHDKAWATWNQSFGDSGWSGTKRDCWTSAIGGLDCRRERCTKKHLPTVYISGLTTPNSYRSYIPIKEVCSKSRTETVEGLHNSTEEKYWSHWVASSLITIGAYRSLIIYLRSPS